MPGVFISYAHRDDQPFAREAEGWVTHFLRNLAAGLGRRAVCTDEDFYLSANAGITPESSKQLADAGVLLILLSPQWLATEACQRELKLFCDSHAYFIRRVFVLEISRVAEGDKPVIMRDFPAYPFWRQTSTPFRQKPGYPLPQAGDATYFSLLVDLSHDLAYTLQHQSGKTPEQASALPIVYVAPVNDYLFPERFRLVSELQQFGITVLPRNNRMDGDVDRELARCSHFIQLLDAQWTMGIPFNLYRAAEHAGKSVLQWRDLWLDYSGNELPDEQRYLLTNESVQVTPLADFIRSVRETVLPGAEIANLDNKLVMEAEDVANSNGHHDQDKPPSRVSWAIVEMRPGKQLFVQLAKALLANKLFASDWNGENAAALMAAELSRGSRSLHEILALTPLPAGTKLLLLVRQFDEVFHSRKQDRNHAAAFVALLKEACKHPDIYVLVSTSPDSPDKAAGFRELSGLVRQGMYSASRLWAGDSAHNPVPEKSPKQSEYAEQAVAGRKKQRFALTAAGSLAVAGLVWWNLSGKQETEPEETPMLAEVIPGPEQALPESDPEVEEAEKQLQQAVNANPQDTEAIHDLAIFMRDVRKDDDRADQLFQQALKLVPDDIHIRDSYAIFLQLNRYDYAGAEKQYQKVLKGMPENANTLANYAQVLLAQGKLREGRQQLDAAFKHYSADYPQSLLLELWFYRFAHFPADYPKARAEISRLLNQGERDEEWDFSGNIAQAERAGHPDITMLKKLSAVILGNADVHTLSLSLGE